jgi:hypothetical protein
MAIKVADPLPAGKIVGAAVQMAGVLPDASGCVAQIRTAEYFCSQPRQQRVGAVGRISQ